jgi:hypothetical protein
MAVNISVELAMRGSIQRRFRQPNRLLDRGPKGLSRDMIEIVTDTQSVAAGSNWKNLSTLIYYCYIKGTFNFLFLGSGEIEARFSCIVHDVFEFHAPPDKFWANSIPTENLEFTGTIGFLWILFG